MPELTESWGKVCRDGVRAANSVAADDRKNYLKYLAERSGSTAPENAYQELVELTDRGLMDTEDVVLDEFEVAGEYVHTLQRQSSMQGEIAVAVGPARIGGGMSSGRTETSQSNLRLRARYRTRPRAEFLQATMDSLPARPVAAALKPGTTGPVKPNA